MAELNKLIKVLFSFRFKILFTLIGSIIFVITLMFIAVRNETANQIELTTEHTALNAENAFKELERVWRENLTKLSLRFTLTNRMPVALVTAIEDDDLSMLTEAALYELSLAGLAKTLVVFADRDGYIVKTILNEQEEKWPDTRLDIANVYKEKREFGYKVFKDVLFAVDIIPLHLFDRHVGYVMLGFPLENEQAQRLSEVIESEIAFIVNGKILLASSGIKENKLLNQFAVNTSTNQNKVIEINHNKWIFISEFLTANYPEDGLRMIARRLDNILAPFKRIEKTLFIIGLTILIITVFSGYFLASGLSSPVRKLSRAAEKVYKGDYNFKVDYKSRDEIGHLADTFNQMIEGLNLKEKYRSLLDKVISQDIAEEMLKGKIFLGGENREVTTFFADIRGFTSLSEGIEPQEVISMLNEYMDIAANIIEEEKGVVDKYIGDEVMAVFGAPVSHEDDPLRALRAGFRILKAMRKLNIEREKQGKNPINIGIGINTGVAVAGNLGSQKRLNYTVIGESVNIASRLCGIAKKGEIIISKDSYKVLKDIITAESLGIVSIKGLVKKVEIYTVTKLLNEK